MTKHADAAIREQEAQETPEFRCPYCGESDYVEAPRKDGGLDLGCECGYMDDQKFFDPAFKAWGMITDAPAGESISERTLRTEDLLPKFMDILWDHNRAAYVSVVDDTPAYCAGLTYNKLLAWTDDRDLSEEEERGADFLLHERVWPAMQDCAPRHHYFGAMEGNSSDFGYWPDQDIGTCENCGPDSVGEYTLYNEGEGGWYVKCQTCGGPIEHGSVNTLLGSAYVGIGLGEAAVFATTRCPISRAYCRRRDPDTGDTEVCAGFNCFETVDFYGFVRCSIAVEDDCDY